MVVNGDRIQVLAERDPAKLPWGELGVDYRARVHRPLHQQGQGRRAPRGRRQEGGDLRARRRGCRCDDRLWRQSRRAQEQPHGHLQRLLHHQLPGAGRQGAARQGRHRRRPHDHDPLLHQRPGADRRVSLGPAPRALGHHVADPDQDRRRGRGGPGAAGTEGQARRLRDPRADHQRVAGRPDLHRQARHHASRRSTRLCKEAAAGGRCKGILAYTDGAAGLGRLQPRSALLDLRCDAHQGHRRHAGQGLRLVRQRVGLLQPHARHHARLVARRS